MFFLLAPINGFLVSMYFLILHTGYLLVIALMIAMGILEWKEKTIEFVDDERQMV